MARGRGLPNLHLFTAALVLCASTQQALGEIRALTADTFSSFLSSSNTPTLVAFTAPWCGHCAKLHPQMELAAAKTTALTFAKVDAEAETSLRDSFGIGSYPTLLHFPPHSAGGASAARIYTGPRSEAGLLDLARRLSRPAVASASAAASAEALIASLGNTGVAFLLLDATAAVEEDARLARAFVATADRLHEGVGFARATRNALQGVPGWAPTLAALSGYAGTILVRLDTESAHLEVLEAAAAARVHFAPGVMTRLAAAEAKRGGRASGAGALPTDAVGTGVLAWVCRWVFPLVSTIDTDNFSALASNPENRPLAIAILPAATDSSAATSRSASFRRALQRIADPATSSLKADVRLRFMYASLDGGRFADFLTQFGLSSKDLPTLLVLDAPEKSFWLDATVQEEEDFDTWLNDIASGKAPRQRQGLLALPQRILNRIGPIGTIAAGCVVGALVLAVIYFLVIKPLCMSAAPAKVTQSKLD